MNDNELLGGWPAVVNRIVQGEKLSRPRVVLGPTPKLLVEPLAIFPSARRDGSIVVLLLVCDSDGNPVIVAAVPAEGELNAVLSVYGKRDGFAWAAKEIAQARVEGLAVYESEGFAASLPQPPAAETASSSPDPISADGTAKPQRKILSLRKKSTEG